MSKVSEELIYRGKILDLARETHRMPDQREARFEIVQHSGGAAALPVLDDGRLLLIRQFRPAARDYVLEIPAGRLEPGEDRTTCIARELEEEIGYSAGEIRSLGYIYSSAGYSTEKIYLFIASDLQPTQTAHEQNEFIEPEILSLAEALDKIASGEINDAKAQVTILRYALEQGVGS